MFEAGLSATFHASHSLRGEFGPAQQLHEHDYRVDVSVFGERLTDDGVLIDIVPLQQSLGTVIDQWNGQNLDRLAGLQGINTTMEMLAQLLHRHICKTLETPAALTLEVKVWEGPNAWGAYRAELNKTPPARH